MQYTYNILVIVHISVNLICKITDSFYTVEDFFQYNYELKVCGRGLINIYKKIKIIVVTRTSETFLRLHI